MARYLAVVLNIQHNQPHEDGIDSYKGYAVIRSADDGLSDAEFQAGARISFYDERSDYAIRRCLETDNYYICQTDAWNQMISEINGTDIQEDHFVYPKKYDKWDTQREIY